MADVATVASGLGVPTATPGPDGQLALTWRQGAQYFEVEIFEEGPSEFFFNDESTGEMFVCEYQPGGPVPLQIQGKLRFLAKKP